MGEKGSAVMDATPTVPRPSSGPRAALDEGHARGADEVYDQRLRPHALDEPAGLEGTRKEGLPRRIERPPGAPSHGRAHPEEQRGKPVSLGDAADHKHDGQHDGHEVHEQAARGANALVKGGLALAAGKRAGGLAEHGAGAGGNDHAAGVA